MTLFSLDSTKNTHHSHRCDNSPFSVMIRVFVRTEPSFVWNGLQSGAAIGVCVPLEMVSAIARDAGEAISVTS